MEIPDEVTEIVAGLVDKTGRGEVQWVPGESDDDFTVNLPDFSVVISNPINGVIEFSIFNDRGNRLVAFETSRTDGDFISMSLLYEGARKKALNVEGALETLKRVIRKPGAIGSSGSSP